jgi:hypothetical protein
MSFRRYLVDQYDTDQRNHLFDLKKEGQDRGVEIDLSNIRQTNLQARAQSGPLL